MKKHKYDNKKLHIARCFALCVLIAAMFSIKSYAEEKDTNPYSLIDDRVEQILDDFEEILPGEMQTLLDPYESSDAVGIKFLLEGIVGVLKGEKSSFVTFLLSLLGASLLMALASLQEGETGKTCKNAVFLVASAIMLDKIFSTVQMVGDSLSEINRFFSSVIPVVTAVNSLGISPGVASAQTLGMSMTLQIYSFFSGDFLYSFIGVMLVLSALSAFDTVTFGRMANTVRKTFLTLIGGLTAFMGATFSLQSMICASADSGVMRGAKYAISGMIPIVGGSISGALSTLAGGVAYLKGIVGGGTIAVIISLALAPLVTLMIYRACFNFAIFFVGICTRDGIDGVFNAFASVFDSMIAIYSLTVAIYIIQLSVFLKGGVGFA